MRQRKCYILKRLTYIMLTNILSYNGTKNFKKYLFFSIMYYTATKRVIKTALGKLI